MIGNTTQKEKKNSVPVFQIEVPFKDSPVPKKKKCTGTDNGNSTYFTEL
jgi:hypothetical protein